MSTDLIKSCRKPKDKNRKACSPGGNTTKEIDETRL